MYVSNFTTRLFSMIRYTNIVSLDYETDIFQVSSDGAGLRDVRLMQKSCHSPSSVPALKSSSSKSMNPSFFIEVGKIARARPADSQTVSPALPDEHAHKSTEVSHIPLIDSSAATLSTAFAESSGVAHSYPPSASLAERNSLTGAVRIGVLINLHKTSASYSNQQGTRSSPRRNNINPTQPRMPQRPHQPPNPKLHRLIADPPRQIKIPRNTRLQNQAFIRGLRLPKVMQRQLRRVSGADEPDVEDSEVGLRGLVGVFGGHEGVVADYGRVGDHDVDALVGAESNGCFEDC